MTILSEVGRRAVTKGLVGGSRTWLILGIAAWIFRLLSWALRPTPTVVARDRIGVGESLLIRHEPAPPTRRQRRRSRRRNKRVERKAKRRSERV